MSNPASPLAAEIEAIRSAYAALNRNDIAGFVRVFDQEIERIEFAGSPQGGSWHGLAAVTEHVAKARATWAEGGCEPQRFVVAGDRLIVIVHVRVRLKTETEWREGGVADAFIFRDGKAILFRSFLNQQQALEWAGIDGRCGGASAGGGSEN